MYWWGMWWGMTCNTVWRWRKALGVEGHDGTEGSRRLILAAQRRAVEQLRRNRPPARVEPPRVACKQDRMRGFHAANLERAWTAGQLALLGILPDDRVAALTGRGANAVRVMRSKLGIPNPSGPGWTAQELDLLGTAPDAEVAERIGRTPTAVTDKRCKLGIPHPEGWGWRPEQLALLGTAPDEEVAARTGKTPAAVTRKRCLLGIPTFCDRRRRENR
jgi:hypothetical protein